jgi:hypothetical protein
LLSQRLKGEFKRFVCLCGVAGIEQCLLPMFQFLFQFPLLFLEVVDFAVEVFEFIVLFGEQFDDCF